ncbi:MAG TPA: protein kinase [Kofleriaceae bacterium]|nr:protein kinase [Kofleriaceae bacterium]
MAPHDGTDPALLTPVPLEGDGHELLGSVIDGRYRLDSTLGRGGMGLVYRATHIGLRRQVAVKILHPSLAASPEVRNRFEREALAVGRIDHPNCVATYDVGRLEGGALYLAMELLEGRSLADVLEQEGQIAPGRALHILAHVLRGLGCIHAAGLIHRDIKPENIFLIRQGEDEDFAKILDFGIAKPMAGELSDDGVRLTQAGMAFGTPIYMAPEQALGNPMDGRADLYAAAVLAYEMLCGQPPFYSDDKLEVMSMHTAKPVPPMRTRLIKGGRPPPSSIEKLIVRGLTKKPADRYANADVFLAAVEQALHTPDGGQTEVNFERPSDTGSQPLVSDDGEVRITGGTASIADDIDEVLASVPTGQAAPLPAAAAAAPPPRAKSTPPPDRGTGRMPTKLGVEPPLVASGEPRGRPAPAGGVGIGLPYTGPSGEPIFGLTPEQRRAGGTRRKARWPLYAVILAVAGVAGIGIAFLTRPSSHEPSPDTPVGAAIAALRGGDPARAIQIITTQKALTDKDPQAQLVLGNAYAAQHDNPNALAAYRHALELDQSTGSNATLQGNLRVMATDNEQNVVMDAFDLWVGHTDDPQARPALQNALVAQSITRRRAARPVADRYKLGDAKQLVSSWALDLEQGETCPIRRDAVAHLRALGNPMAIDPLDRARSKRRFNACLLEDAKDAIAVLRAQKRKP